MEQLDKGIARFFTRQRSTINYLASAKVESHAVFQAHDAAYEENNYLRSIFLPYVDYKEFSADVDFSSLPDFKDLAQQISYMTTRIVVVNLIGNECPIIIYIDGEEYIGYNASIYTIYSLGSLTLFKNLKQIPKLIVLADNPILIVKQSEDSKKMKLELIEDNNYHRLLDNGYSAQMMVYEASVFVEYLPSYRNIDLKFDTEYDVPEIKSKIGERIIKNIVEFLVKEYESFSYKKRQTDKELLFIFDFVFQELDLILVLLAINTELPDPLDRRKLSIIFTQKTNSYVRRPLSLYLDNLDIINNRWTEFIKYPGLFLSTYQTQRRLVIESLKSRRDVNNLDTESLPSSSYTYNEYKLSYDPMDAIDLVKRRIESEAADMTVDLVPNTKWYQDTNLVGRVLYEEFFRDEKIGEMKLSYWNLKKVVPVFQIPGEPFKPPEDDKPEDKYEFDNPKKSVNEYGMLYAPLEEESELQIRDLKHRYIRINGIEFRSLDLKLFYNTFIWDTLIMTQEQSINLPLIPLTDIHLLRDLFNGRVSLLYFYEKIDKYTYLQFSGKRTMLDIFDFLPARRLIIEQFRIGIRLKEQIRNIDNPWGDITISRLSELIEITNE